MVTIKTLRVRDKENSTKKENSIISEEIDLNALGNEIDMLLRKKGLSPMPTGDIAEFLQKAVENHNNMTRQVCAFWCPELQAQV